VNVDIVSELPLVGTAVLIVPSTKIAFEVVKDAGAPDNMEPKANEACITEPSTGVRLGDDSAVNIKGTLDCPAGAGGKPLRT
jgi:hypothetical protein